MSNWSPREASREYTRWELIKNWLYYYKWVILAVAGVVWLLGSVLHTSLSYRPPDYQIAYVGEYSLPTDAIEALQDTFAELGEDLNGDGKVDVLVNCYAGSSDPSLSPQIQAASIVQLTADLQTGDSYIFLLEDPEGFQQQYPVLALADGSAPEDEEDTSIEGKVVAWQDCPALNRRELPLEADFAVKKLYLGRRVFYGKQPEHLAGWSALWDAATAGAPIK